MENEIVKDTIRVGNSAGVLLPKSWLNSRVKIVLEPLNIKKDVLDILLEENLLNETLGAYIVGSYARKDETIESDVDILVITNNIDKRIRRGKYDMLLVSKKELEEQLENNALPLIPMIRESLVIINPELLNEYKKIDLTKKNIKWHLETTKSAMKVVEEFIKAAEETNKKVSDAAAYSLILRLRTLYILDCLRKNKIWKKREFLNLIKKISGSLTAYERYLDSKNNNSAGSKLPIEEAKKLKDYIDKDVEKWLKE